MNIETKNEILTIEQLGLPPIVNKFADYPRGLVLVTGPTGSGKSTTLCALIDLINRSRADHVITIEDPIEFVHESKKCLITQRHVGVHTSSFKHALRAALREDPDIILVGELRDLETVAIAIETAETGHLVFGTLHTTTAASTVDRIVDQFPADHGSHRGRNRLESGSRGGHLNGVLDVAEFKREVYRRDLFSSQVDARFSRLLETLRHDFDAVVSNRELREVVAATAIGDRGSTDSRVYISKRYARAGHGRFGGVRNHTHDRGVSLAVDALNSSQGYQDQNSQGNHRSHSNVLFRLWGQVGNLRPIGNRP